MYKEPATVELTAFISVASNSRRKGEQAAIEQRRQEKEFEQAIDEAIREGNEIAKGIKNQ